MGDEAVENFVFLQVRVLFYAVQILFKVTGIIWLSAGYVIFRVEEFVRVCSRFKGYDLVAAAMLFWSQILLLFLRLKLLTVASIFQFFCSLS